MLRLDYKNILPFLKEGALEEMRPACLDAHRKLVNRSGAGAEMLGWRDLLAEPNDALLGDVERVAAEIRAEADVLLCIGIGGSYLGARAVIDALTPYFGDKKGPEIIFVGHQMSGAYMQDLLAYLQGKSVFVNVISKSGTTLEPAIAFRFIRKWVDATFEDAIRRIIVTTDPEMGALNVLHHEVGYRKFVIPPSVGGRFSVLTPVGLLPIAVAGVDIRSLFYGAVAGYKRFNAENDNPALDYAILRYDLLRMGYSTELLSVFEPRIAPVGGWWQQLFGESEGKDNKGIYPDTLQFSTDLHSLGQYVQQGQRTLFETFLMIENDGGSIRVPETSTNLDGLGYVAGKAMTEINGKAYEGTAIAHLDGGVPNMTLWMDAVSPEAVGELIYFFEHAVSVSGYLLDVNPFDQPGVEAYKKEMFRLLGRP